MNTRHHMTGAELQTYREAAGLTREALGELVEVAARTVKHWETREGAAVPADVQAIARSAAQWVREAAAELLARELERQRKGESYQVHHIGEQFPRLIPGLAMGAPVLIRYRETAHMPASDRAQGVRADVHGAMVARLTMGLADSGTAARVVWFDPLAFDTWRSQGNQADTPNTRAVWAAQTARRAPTAPRHSRP